MYIVINDSNQYLYSISMATGLPVWTKWKQDAWATKDRWIANAIAQGVGGHIAWNKGHVPSGWICPKCSNECL